MSRRAALLSLAERCEKATAGSRELGEAILVACGWRKTSVGYFYGPLYHWSSPDGKTSFKDDDFSRHNPATSLDAAMRLVPEGWEYEVSNRAPAPLAGRAHLNNRELIYKGIGSRRNPKRRSSECIASTPTLALCAASLRALAEMENTDA